MYIYKLVPIIMSTCYIFLSTCQIFMKTVRPSWQIVRCLWQLVRYLCRLVRVFSEKIDIILIVKIDCDQMFISTSVSSSYLIYKIYFNRDTLYISHLPLNYIPTMVISSLPTMHRFTLNSLSPFTHTHTIHKGVNLSTNQNAPHDFMMSTSRHNQNFFSLLNFTFSFI